MSRFDKSTALLLAVLVSLLAGCSDTGSESAPKFVKTKRSETVPENWYIRITAEDPARGMKSVSAQLGELDEENATQRHTLKALAPFGGPYLDVIFPDPEGVEQGEYKVNFRTADTRQENQWTFTVRTDDPDADILLSWRGVYLLTPYEDGEKRTRYREYRSRRNPLIRYMKLEDLKTGETFAVSDGTRNLVYRFNMDGATERSFRWILQEDPVEAPFPDTQTLKKLSTAMEKTAQEGPARPETFDLEHPPGFKDQK